MPNTFGDPASSGQLYELYDPRHPLRHRQRFRRDLVPLLRRANSLYVPSGRWPARGFLLLRRGDYDNLSKYSIHLQLSIEDVQTGTARVFKNLSIVQARCVTAGFVGTDPDSLMLVEVTDAR